MTHDERNTMQTFIYGVEIEAENREQANAVINDLLTDAAYVNGWAAARVNPWPEIIDRDEAAQVVGHHA